MPNIRKLHYNDYNESVTMTIFYYTDVAGFIFAWSAARCVLSMTVYSAIYNMQ